MNQIKFYYFLKILTNFSFNSLILINLKYSPQFQWFWFSAVGWGFGLTMHALKVFGYSANWEERKIKEILSKENSKQTWE